LEKYQCLLNKINLTKEWDSDEIFFIDIITKGSIKLIEICYDDLNKYNLIPIFPMLRQVQENCVVLIGFGEKEITAKEFVEKKVNAKEIFKSIDTRPNIEKSDLSKSQALSEYLKELKETLNNYSHTNLDGLMQLFVEDYQVIEIKKVNELIVKLMIDLVESVFIGCVNYFYKLKIAAPNVSNFKRSMKDIGSLRYIADKLPENISEFIKNSEVLGSYYRNLESNIRKDIVFLKEINKKDNSKTYVTDQMLR